ncbi:hypothetical protein ACFS27_23260 [Promicromonospora vindobonensis]|uniref:Histidine kinase/DNA gyrase B/HSP90-like ATPase n=1 Tax=Promicromonospora vindobonensis TaxID=195748 RepID=A0ABW5VZ30_9MICO
MPEELIGLNSDAPTDRARAVGWLVLHPHAITTRELMQALQIESVPQVRRLLIQVLEMRQSTSTSAGVGVAEEFRGEDGGVTAGVVTSSHVDIAALVRHELSPAVGWIRLAADSEIPNFGNSRTNDAVRKLQRRIDGLVALIKSGEELNVRRLSLPHLLLENWPDAQGSPSVDPAVADGGVDIETDEGLFSVLLQNVFQNAIDASVDAAGEVRVQVTWGFTERNYWIRVTNPFKGNRFSLSDVIQVGNSSKMAHQGQGLALIQTVADRLGLAFGLEGISGTASFSLSGARPDA